MLENSNLDHIYGLAGTAIAAELKDYVEGFYEEQPVSSDLWRNTYLEAPANYTFTLLYFVSALLLLSYYFSTFTHWLYQTNCDSSMAKVSPK